MKPSYEQYPYQNYQELLRVPYIKFLLRKNSRLSLKIIF